MNFSKFLHSYHHYESAPATVSSTTKSASSAQSSLVIISFKAPLLNYAVNSCSYFPADILYHRTLSYPCKRCSNLIQSNQKKIKYYHTPALHLTHHTPSQHSIFFSFSSHSSILCPTGNCPFTLLSQFLTLK